MYLHTYTHRHVACPLCTHSTSRRPADLASPPLLLLFLFPTDPPYCAICQWCEAERSARQRDAHACHTHTPMQPHRQVDPTDGVSPPSPFFTQQRHYGIRRCRFSFFSSQCGDTRYRLALRPWRPLAPTHTHTQRRAFVQERKLEERQAPQQDGVARQLARASATTRLESRPLRPSHFGPCPRRRRGWEAGEVADAYARLNSLSPL